MRKRTELKMLTDKYETYERPGIVLSYLQGMYTIYKGALVGVDPDGLLVPMDYTREGLKFVGVSCETCKSGQSVCVTKYGSFVYPSDEALDRRDLGSVVYALTDNTVTTKVPSPYAYPVGTIVSIETTSDGKPGCRISINNHRV